MNWLTRAYPGDAFASIVWTVLLQVTLVTLLAWVVVRLLGRSRPTARQAVGRCSLALVLLSPALAWTLPQLGWRARWLPVERWWSEGTVAGSARVGPGGKASIVGPDVPHHVADRRLQTPWSGKESQAVPPAERHAMLPSAVPPAPSDFREDGVGRLSERSAPADAPAVTDSRRAVVRGFVTLATGVWFAGILVLAGRWWSGHRRLTRLCWDLSPLDETAWADVLASVRQAIGVSRLPAIRVSRLAPMPLLIRPWRPVVILPASLVASAGPASVSAMECRGGSGLRDQLHDALVHECAHVLRHDLWISVGERVAAILYWPHPGVHWLNRELAQSREEVSDNYVLRHRSAASYAETLLELAEQYTAELTACPPMGILSPRWTLEQRVAGLLDPRRSTNTRCGVLTVVAILAVAFTANLLVGGVCGGSSEPAEPPTVGGNAKPLPDADARPSTPGRSEEPFSDAAVPSTSNASPVPGPDKLVELELADAVISSQPAASMPPGPIPAPAVPVPPVPISTLPTPTSIQTGPVASTRILRGRVVDENAHPVAMAKIVLPLRPSRDAAQAQTLVVHSDDQGRFEMSIPDAWLGSGRRMGTGAVIWAGVQGRQLRAVDVGAAVHGPTPRARELNIVLGPPTHTGFVVTDPDGKPLPGATIAPRDLLPEATYVLDVSRRGVRIPRELLPLASSTTDAAGQVRLPALSANEIYSVEVTARGFGTQVFDRTGWRADDRGRISLQATGRIEGRVVGARPEWVSGLRLMVRTTSPAPPPPFQLAATGRSRIPVRLVADVIRPKPTGLDFPALPPNWMWIRSEIEVTTDAEGRFVVPAIAAGDTYVRAVCDPSVPVRLCSEIKEIEPGKTVAWEIPLRPTVLVRGVVRSQNNGRPVAGICVAAKSGLDGQETVTNQDGEFQVRVLPGGVMFFITPTREAPYETIDPSKVRRVTVPQGADSFETPPIIVQPLVRVSGRILDKDGQGMAHARVEANGRSWDVSWTDAQGRFTIFVPSIRPKSYLVVPEGEKSLRIAEIENEDPFVLRCPGPHPASHD